MMSKSDETGIWGKDILSIAAEFELTFKHIDRLDDEIVTDFTKRDPDIVYLLDTGFQIKPVIPNAKPCDATLFFKGNRWPVRYEHTTKAWFRKVFANLPRECAVCFTLAGTGDTVNCEQCNCTVCSVCLMKMTLDEYLLERIQSDAEYRANYRCVECRHLMMVDTRTVYHRVLHRLKQFTKEQQTTLLFIKEHDPDFEERMMNWKEWEKMFPLEHFRKGSVVRLHGLKTKKQWNRKKAIIIADGVLKDDTYRWPVQLLDESKSRALIKQSNLTKLRQR